MNKGEVILFQSDDGHTKIQVRFEEKSVWLTQASIAELFQTTPQNITLHLKAIYEEKELSEEATCKEYLQVRSEGKRQIKRQLKHYSLEAILAVGYRVRSPRGAQFRQWATAQLQELLLKGFVMDDDRLKKGKSGGADYFDELLARIRDIRSSERIFWRKVLDIYSTSIDYDADSETSKHFFAVVQNKMHWAAHGKTAAEVITERADASRPNMGLTSWTGARPKKFDTIVAKNYLAQDELSALNLIVSAYLDFAELQAHGRKPMHMKDWIMKLDSFLQLSDREVLAHAGKVSREQALEKSKLEYEKFSKVQDTLPSPVDIDFEQAVDEIRKINSRNLKSADPRSKKNKSSKTKK